MTVSSTTQAPPPRTVLTGGGTGGHVYPAIAIYRRLQQAGLVGEALYLGVRGRAEERIVPQYGIPVDFVPSAPVAGGSLWRKVRALAVVARGSFVAAAKLLRFRPRWVIATGGYVSAPVIFAAFLLKPVLGTKIIIHEQNLFPGALNKLASLLARVVFVSFPETAYFIWSQRCVHSGYPVRLPYLEEGPAQVDAKRELGLGSHARLLLIYGGSMGARSINRALAASIEELSEVENLVIVHGIGLSSTADYDARAEVVESLSRSLGERFDSDTLEGRDGKGRVFYRGYDYLDDLVLYQRAADLIVCRGGAGSLAESVALGKPMLVVPKRGLPGDHQEVNAIGLAEKGAAEVLFERRDEASGVDEVAAREFSALVLSLLSDEERCQALSAGARAAERAGVSRSFATTLRALQEGREPEYLSGAEEPPFVRFQRQFDALVLHLNRTGSDDLYRRLYDLKVDEYLRSPHPMTVNKGIKLVGALRRADKYPFLLDGFDSFQGFQRRNALTALSRARVFDPRFVEVLSKGLKDSYFEARREAVSLYCRFYLEVAELDQPVREAIHSRLLKILHRSTERFEVRAEAIRAAIRFLDEKAFLKEAQPFVHATQIRYREALLDSVEFGLSHELFQDGQAVRQLVDSILITTSDFSPVFRIRERYSRVLRELEEQQ